MVTIGQNMLKEISPLTKTMSFKAALDLAVSLHNDKAYDKAWNIYRQLHEADPENADVLNLMGALCLQQKHLEQAIPLLRRAVSTNPRLTGAWNNLGATYLELGLLKEARSAFNEALKLNPDSANAVSNYLYSLNFDPDLSAKEIAEDHCRLGFRWENKSRKSVYRHDKIRIGYVSGDFCSHSISHFFLPLLRHHDRQRFVIYAYSNLRKPDKVTATIKTLCDVFRDIHTAGDDSVAELIRKDEIDILVDLSGYTRDNRLPVFARHPAPVQMTWLGYPNTTGMQAMDYRLTDWKADPAGYEKLYSETLLRLDGCFLAYENEHSVAIRSRPPCIRNNRFTFASFNTWRKVNLHVLRVWAEILRRTGNSRLMLKSAVFDTPSIGSDVRQFFAAQGIEPERLVAQPWLDKAEHLALYNQVDLALDPFPYNGTTTTCEAFSMSVPVLTLQGDRHACRVGASLLYGIGHPELITGNTQAYIDKAVELAGSTETVRHLRQRIREDFLASGLSDAKAFARKFEHCLLSLPEINV